MQSSAMSRRLVNIATISEEDVFGEELCDDGTVAMVSPTRCKNVRDDGSMIRKRSSDPTGTGRLESERRSSIVEVDGDDDTTEASSSILKAISSLDGPSSKTSLARSRSTESLSYSTRSLPAAVVASGTSTNSMKRTASWRNSRTPGSTMNLSGKFVTEITMYNPSNGPTKCSCVNLGMFIATDQIMGDHFVYKMSPVSPLLAFKIQAQDRLLKVNDISVSGLSHSCLVEFIRNLPLSLATTVQSPKDTVYEMPFCMEFRKTGKVVRSADEASGSRRVDATLRIRNLRATLLNIHECSVRVKYANSTTARIRLKSEASDEQELLLKTSISDKNVIAFHTGTEAPEDEAFFRLHHFDESPPRKERGDLVVVETPGGNGFLHASSPESVAVMHCLTTPPSTLLQIDVRFFQLLTAPGSSAVRIRNVVTGRFLTATADNVTLASLNADMTFPSSSLFEIETCHK